MSRLLQCDPEDPFQSQTYEQLTSRLVPWLLSISDGDLSKVDVEDGKAVLNVLPAFANCTVNEYIFSGTRLRSLCC
jgi:hypothetical protein